VGKSKKFLILCSINLRGEEFVKIEIRSNAIMLDEKAKRSRTAGAAHHQNNPKNILFRYVIYSDCANVHIGLGLDEQHEGNERNAFYHRIQEAVKHGLLKTIFVKIFYSVKELFVRAVVERVQHQSTPDRGHTLSCFTGCRKSWLVASHSLFFSLRSLTCKPEQQSDGAVHMYMAVPQD
jgi:hypothetical protein